MNVGEWGIVHDLLVGYDISGFQSLSLTYTRPDKTVFTATNPDVGYGNTPLTTSDGTFPANQYSTYKFKDGDLSVAGIYSVRLTYTDATKHLVSDAVTFTVNP